MKEVRTISWCDYPDCNGHETYPSGQETFTTEVLVNVVSRGRKSQAITVELCEPHRDLLKGIYLSMQKFDQKVG